MTLTAYTRRASYGDGDWKSRHCITQPLRNYFRAAPENSRKLRSIALYSTCSSAQHPSLRPYTFELDLHGSTSKAQTPESASTALGTQASGWFIGGTRKERRCFAAECGPDPFEHTRALEGPFSDLRIRAPRCRGRGSSSPAPPFGIWK